MADLIKRGGGATDPGRARKEGLLPLPRLEGACCEGEETRLASRIGGMEHT